jgi:hypothetical protein
VKKSTTEDKRVTLYWNAEVLTDKSGNSGQSFFTADNRAVYTIIVMGITENGNLIAKKIHVKQE